MFCFVTLRHEDCGEKVIIYAYLFIKLLYYLIFISADSLLLVKVIMGPGYWRLISQSDHITWILASDWSGVIM